MARYIEETEIYKLVEPHGTAKVHCSQIDVLPRADVVPKSEVAKEFTCFVGDPHKVDHCPYLDEIEKARTEVERLQAEKDALIKNYAECMKDYASEIFAETDNIINDYKLAERNLRLMQHGEPSIDQRYAEFKKKYTEGEE